MKQKKPPISFEVAEPLLKQYVLTIPRSVAFDAIAVLQGIRDQRPIDLTKGSALATLERHGIIKKDKLDLDGIAYMKKVGLIIHLSACAIDEMFRRYRHLRSTPNVIVPSLEATGLTSYEPDVMHVMCWLAQGTVGTSKEKQLAMHDTTADTGGIGIEGLHEALRTSPDLFDYQSLLGSLSFNMLIDRIVRSETILVRSPNASRSLLEFTVSREGDVLKYKMQVGYREMIKEYGFLYSMDVYPSDPMTTPM